MTVTWTGAGFVTIPESSVSQGTWTPNLKFGGGTTGMTYSARSGFWYRIGNIVFFNCDLTLSAKGSSTGAAEIYDLPVASTKSISAGLVYYANLVGISARGALCRVDSTATWITLAWNNADAGPGAITDTAFQDTTRLILSGWYPV